MLPWLFVAVSFASVVPAPQVPPGPPSELVLRIYATPIYPDGRQGGFAGTDGISTSVSTYLFAGSGHGGGSNSPCSTGASGPEPTTTPLHGWRVSGRVLQRASDNLLVAIEWQRLWDQGQRIENGLKGSMQVSLRAGDKLPLDEISVNSVPGCAATGTHLEATVFERDVPPPSAKMNGTVGVHGFGPAGSGGTSGLNVVTNGTSPAPPVDVDLWLVHTLSNGAEQAQRVTLSASPSTRFQFPAITIATSNGDATVEISGQVAALIDQSGEKQLRVLIQRVVRDNPKVNGQGMSVKLFKMPGPDDVYSFETPDLRMQAESIRSDKVSLRLRIAQKRD